MAPPKNKTVKMDLNSFLNDESFQSSWAADDVDVTKINIPIENASANTIPLEELAVANKAAAGGRGRRGPGGDAGFGTWTGRSLMDPALSGRAEPRRAREEYPVPDHPPYRAIINNIPWDITPEGVKAWVEDGLNKPGAVEDLELPKSFNDPSRLKGMAFVTFKEREDLVQALTFSGTKLNERTVYVSVAAPRRGGGGFGGDSDFDWSAARGSNFQASRPPRERREEPELEWGAARGSNFQASRPPRERREEPELEWGAARGSNFQASRPPRERREEPELEWGAARGSNFQASRPPRERREEPELEWGAARGSNFQASRPPRQGREEPELEWGAARGSNFQASRPPRQRREEPELDWSSARGARFGKNSTSESNGTTTSATSSSGYSGRYGRRAVREEKTADDNQPKVQASSFDVLRTEDDADDDDNDSDSDAVNNNSKASENEEETAKAEDKPKSDSDVTQVQQQVANLSVDDGSDWEVVGKK